MRILLITSTLVLTGALAQAQDPGMMAAQQAAQQATMAAQQASQQAAQDMQQATQNAQRMAQSMQDTSMNAPCCSEAKPKFSARSGRYGAPVTVTMKDGGRDAVIYYTTDGATPSATSTRYSGPITISSTTTLHAIAISPHGLRSRVATAVYRLDGAPPPAAPAPPASGSQSLQNNATSNHE